jgi:MtN3 and saliva related transmembrane protein
MTTAAWIQLTGAVGGFFTTFAFVPQVIKIWKQGGRDLSYGMLGFYLTGVFLWLGYGFLLHAREVIVTNAVTALLIAFATALKAWKERSEPASAPDSLRAL